MKIDWMLLDGCRMSWMDGRSVKLKMFYLVHCDLQQLLALNKNHNFLCSVK